MLWWQKELKLNIYKKLAVYSYLITLNLATISNESENVNGISDEISLSRNFKCDAFNCQRLTCTWTVPASFEFLSLKMEVGRTIRKCGHQNINMTNFPDYIKYQCNWNTASYACLEKEYNFTLENRYIPQNVTIEDDFRFDHYASVIPAAPKNLRFANITSNSVLLKWDRNIDMLGFEPGFRYQIAYKSEYNQQWSTLDISGEDERGQPIYEYWLKNLHPYTKYQISMRIQSKLAKNDRYWSEYSRQECLTDEAIPEKPPDIVNGSFYVEHSLKNRNVTLYWKKLTILQQNSNQIDYIFKINRNNTWRSITPNETGESHAKFFNLEAEEYIFQIYSKNKVGLSKNFSVIQIPGSDSMIDPPSDFFLTFTNESVELFWKMNNNNLNIRNFVIFWCKQRGILCEDDANWIVVDGKEKSCKINSTGAGNYQFAIAAQTSNSSSGLLWNRCDSLCSSHDCLEVGNIGHSEVELMWKFNCWREKITGFLISYCVLNNNGSDCGSNLQEIPVPGDIYTHRTILQNLEPFTLYQIGVKINSDEPIGKPVIVKTTEHNPTPARNFKVVEFTNTSITVSWNSPIRFNGLFKNYIIRYKKTEDRVWLDFSKIFNNSTNNEVLTNLHFNTEYEIELSACNTASKCSFVSTKQRTKVGKPGKIQNVRTILLDDPEKISFTWKEPIGVINTTHKYEYRYEFIKNNKPSGIEKSEHILNNSVSLNLPSEVCKGTERGNGTYIKWQVRGIVMDEMNNELRGEWSDETKIMNIPLCTAAAVIIISTYLLGFIISVTIITFSIISLIKFVRRCFDIDVVLPGVLKDYWVIDNVNENNQPNIQYTEMPIFTIDRKEISVQIGEKHTDLIYDELNSGRLEQPYLKLATTQQKDNRKVKMDNQNFSNENTVSTKTMNNSEQLVQASPKNNSYFQLSNLELTGREKPVAPVINYVQIQDQQITNENNLDKGELNNDKLGKSNKNNHSYCRQEKSNQNKDQTDPIHDRDLTQIYNKSNPYLSLDILNKPSQIIQKDTTNFEALNENTYLPLNKLINDPVSNGLRNSVPNLNQPENAHQNAMNLPVDQDGGEISQNKNQTDSINDRKLTQTNNKSNPYLPLDILNKPSQSTQKVDAKFEALNQNTYLPFNKLRTDPASNRLNSQDLTTSSDEDESYWSLVQPEMQENSQEDQDEELQNSIIDEINSREARSSNVNINPYCRIDQLERREPNESTTRNSRQRRTNSNPYSTVDILRPATVNMQYEMTEDDTPYVQYLPPNSSTNC